MMSCSTSSSDSNTDHSEDYEGWNEEATQTAWCIFCEENVTIGQEYLEHLKNSHNLDIKLVVKRLNLDLTGLIKMINYIRKKRINAPKSQPLLESCSFENLRNILYGQNTSSKTKPLFESDEYLIPVIKDDPIFYMLEDFFEQ